MGKNPKFSGVSPETSKRPRLQLGKTLPGSPVWAIARADFGGPWCPQKMQRDTLVNVLGRLKDFERSTWQDIERGGSHFISVSNVIREAQLRLQELKLDDTDELFSLRLTGKERLWGIRSNDKFALLWWDPEHQICPAPLKNT